MKRSDACYDLLLLLSQVRDSVLQDEVAPGGVVLFRIERKPHIVQQRTGFQEAALFWRDAMDPLGDIEQCGGRTCYVLRVVQVDGVPLAHFRDRYLDVGYSGGEYELLRTVALQLVAGQALF